MQYLGKNNVGLSLPDDEPIEEYIKTSWIRVSGPKPVEGEYVVQDGGWVLDISIDEQQEREWRDKELTTFVDPLQRVLVWYDLSDAAQQAITVYRRELLDYPQQVDFPDVTRPVRPVI